MRTKWTLAACLTAASVLVGCQSLPPGAEPGPQIKIFGDVDGTFHDFGSYYYVVKASPITTNQYPQSRYFRTGHLLTPEDHIPSKIYFDMNQPQPNPPAYAYPPPPSYYYYGPPPYYYGPSFRFYYGPGYYHHW